MTAAPMELPLPDSSSPGCSSDGWSRFSSLRGVRWRFNLGILPSLPSASIDDLRRVTADARRSYAGLRRRLLIDPHITKDGNKSPDLLVENPLSQNPGTNADDFNQIKLPKITSFDDLDRDTRDVLLLSDSYGAEGELGIVLSEKFMEHDAYCMFDGLMSGAGGVVAMNEFFCSCPSMGSSTGLPPIIEASSALNHLLSIVDSSLHGHLIDLGVEPQYFALRWLRVLFGREFSLSDLLVIWDELFSAFNGSCVENDEDRFRILCSPRGAFISAMAVSMLLHVRSSLLATENATSCLKRLLNFSRNVSVEKLIEKARSYQVLALEINTSVSSQAGLAKIGSFAASRAGSPSLKSAIRIMPDSYWEEKWRVLHNEKVLQNSDSSNDGQIKGLLGETLGSSRTKSYPSPAKTVNGENEAHSFAKRSLFDDLSQSAESVDDLVHYIPTGQELPPLDEDVRKSFSEESGYESSIKTSEFIGEESLSTGNSVFSMNTGSNSEANDPEIESEKSSVTSISFLRENEDDNDHLEGECSNASNNPVPIESEAIADIAKSGPSVNVEVKGVSEKVRKSASGKFKWFWRIGKGSFSERSMEKGTIADIQRSPNIGKESVCQEQVRSSAFDYSNCGDGARVEVGDMKMMGTVKNLAQSMLENVQVIESVFQQEQVQAGNIIGFNDQAAAMAALNELRKISIILSDI